MSEQIIRVPGKFVPFEAGTPLMDEKDIKKTSQVDSEDVKTEGGVLKFADKAYVPNDFSGMGRVYLRKNMINASLHFADIISDLPSTETETLFDCDEIVYETTHNRFLAVKHTSEGKKYYPNYQFTDSEVYSSPDDKHIYVCDANAKLYTYKNDALEETTTLMDKNVLTQDMINKPNTIYIIQYDYDIVDKEDTTTTNNLTIGGEYYSYKPITIEDNQTYRALNDCVFINYHNNTLIGSVLVTGYAESQDYAVAKKSNAVSGVPVSYYKPNGIINVPANCVLQFEGGSIKNGSIVGNSTKIVADHTRIFTDVILSGVNSFDVDVLYTSWWITNIDDNTKEFQNILSSIAAIKNKNICIENRIRISDVNLTNTYVRGIRFYSNVDYTYKTVGIVVFGDDSQGLDISGSAAITFENVLFTGDENNKPKTLIYASRTDVERSCWYHRFINCWFLGGVTETLLYNYAGECWEIVNCQFRTANTMNSALYFTASNSRNLVSKFANTISAPNYPTPLTYSMFRSCSFFNYHDNPNVCFEANSLDANAISSQITFDNCYFYSPKHNSVRFIGVTSGITFRNCTDESGVGYNPSVYTRTTPHYEFLNYGSTKSWLTGVVIINNNLFCCNNVPLIKCDNYAKKFVVEANNYSGNTSLDFSERVNDSKFNDLDVFTSLNVANANNIIVNTTNKELINIGGNTPKIPKNGFAIIDDKNPYENYGASDNAIAKRSIFDIYYLGIGESIYDWRELSIKIYANLASPTKGINLKKGQIVWANEPQANGFVGAVATSDGTTGNLNATYSTVPGTNTLIVSDTSDLIVGQSLYITNNIDFWINRVIADINRDTNIVTLNGSALTTVVNDMPLYWTNPNLRPFGMLCITAANDSAIETTSLLKGFGYFNTTANQMRYWNGTTWSDATGTPV